MCAYGQVTSVSIANLFYNRGAVTDSFDPMTPTGVRESTIRRTMEDRIRAWLKSRARRRRLEERREAIAEGETPALAPRLEQRRDSEP